MTATSLPLWGPVQGALRHFSAEATGVGVLRRPSDLPTLLALFAALGVHTGAHDQIDSSDYNCEINTRWHLTVAFIGGARRSRTADLLNAIQLCLMIFQVSYRHLYMSSL
jgi:hypothetical protein